MTGEPGPGEAIRRRRSLRPGEIVGRFAPAPTGPLHLGSLVAAVGSYLSARASGGRWLIRIEDLDTPRVVTGADVEILEALTRYGLQWDGEPQYQSRRGSLYAAALDRLRSAGRLFDCGCSRSDLLRAGSAPLAADAGDILYPGTCRHGLPPGKEARAIRFRVSGETVRFDDQIHGRVAEDLSSRTGDFVVRRADGQFAYQLAVVVDDADQGVTQIVRGADLLASTPRQIALQRALGYATPEYAHLPLVLGPKGAKIGKRDGALPLPTLDRDRVAATLALALRIVGIDEARLGEPREMLEEAVTRFAVHRVPRASFIIP
jgi:glutamyl-Q tRNA(Asp) synthetase